MASPSLSPPRGPNRNGSPLPELDSSFHTGVEINHLRALTADDVRQDDEDDDDANNETTTARALLALSPRNDSRASLNASTMSQATEDDKRRRKPPNPERKSQFRGVSWQKTSKAWVAQYKSAGKTTYLGLFATEQAAAKAYDVAISAKVMLEKAAAAGSSSTTTVKSGTAETMRLNFGPPSQAEIDDYIKGNVPAGRVGGPGGVRQKMKGSSSSAKTSSSSSSNDKGEASHVSTTTAVTRSSPNTSSLTTTTTTPVKAGRHGSVVSLRPNSNASTALTPTPSSAPAATRSSSVRLTAGTPRETATMTTTTSGFRPVTASPPPPPPPPPPPGGGSTSHESSLIAGASALEQSAMEVSEMDLSTSSSSRLDLSGTSNTSANSQRAKRRPKKTTTTSVYRGVSWYAARQIWKSSIQVNRQKEYIGRFETEEEAALAYNEKAKQLKGDAAVLNVVPNTRTRYPAGFDPSTAPPRPSKGSRKKTAEGAQGGEAATTTTTKKRKKASKTNGDGLNGSALDVSTGVPGAEEDEDESDEEDESEDSEDSSSSSDELDEEHGLKRRRSSSSNKESVMVGGGANAKTKRARRMGVVASSMDFTNFDEDVTSFLSKGGPDEEGETSSTENHVGGNEKKSAGGRGVSLKAKGGGKRSMPNFSTLVASSSSSSAPSKHNSSTISATSIVSSNTRKEGAAGEVGIRGGRKSTRVQQQRSAMSPTTATGGDAVGFVPTLEGEGAAPGLPSIYSAMKDGYGFYPPTPGGMGSPFLTLTSLNTLPRGIGNGSRGGNAGVGGGGASASSPTHDVSEAELAAIFPSGLMMQGDFGFVSPIAGGFGGGGRNAGLSTGGGRANLLLASAGPLFSGGGPSSGYYNSRTANSTTNATTTTSNNNNAGGGAAGGAMSNALMRAASAIETGTSSNAQSTTVGTTAAYSQVPGTLQRAALSPPALFPMSDIASPPLVSSYARGLDGDDSPSFSFHGGSSKKPSGKKVYTPVVYAHRMMAASESGNQ